MSMIQTRTVPAPANKTGPNQMAKPPPLLPFPFLAWASCYRWRNVKAGNEGLEKMGGAQG